MHLRSNAAPVLCRDTGCPVSSLNSHLRNERRAQLAALLDASGTVLRLAAPVVDLLVRLSLSKAFFAPGMLPSNHLVEFVQTGPQRVGHSLYWGHMRNAVSANAS